MNRYISWMLSHSRTNIGIFCALFIISAFLGFSVKTDNGMEVWMPEESQPGIQYDKFIEQFGSEEFILVAFHMPEGLTLDCLRLTQKLARMFEEQEGIRKVWSLDRIFDRPLGNFQLFKEVILKSSFCRGMLISPDGKVSAIILAPSVDGIRNRVALVDKIRNILSNEVPPDIKVFIAGPPVINVELDRMSQQVSVRYSPLLFLVCLSVLLIFFRSLAGVAIPALMMAGSLFITIGWMGIFRASINIITAACFPLIMVISLAHTIYVLNAYKNSLKNDGGSTCPEDKKKEAILAAFRDVSLPVFLSAFTTSVGFGSLMTSEIAPVKNLGLIVSLGVLSVFFLAMTFLPLALFMFPSSAFSGERRPQNERINELMRFTGIFVMRCQKRILFFCFLAMVVFLCGIFRLKVETQILNFFLKDSAIVRAYRFIEGSLTGLSPIEIVIESEKSLIKNGELETEAFEKIKALQKYLSLRKEVLSAYSLVNIISDKTRIDFLDMFFVSKSPMLSALDDASKDYINDSGTATRVSVRAKTLPSKEYRTLIADIDNYLSTHFKGSLRSHTTGIVPIIVHMQDSLLNNLIKSFAIAFGVISLVFLILVRSIKNMILCMIPNIMPIVVILGFMGWVGINLDVATIMISSIAIGIIVDNTIHFITRFRRENANSSGYAHSIQSTLKTTGKPIFTTSIITFCGFFVLCFSGFMPMIYFGLLSGITIIVALAGDIIVLPALLVYFKARFD